MEYGDVFDHAYEYMCGPSYEDYVSSCLNKVIANAPHDKAKTLSVGCGDGTIENHIGDQLDITAYDIHDACAKKHPNIRFTTVFPEDKFDYVYCIGDVILLIPYEKKLSFIKQLFSVLKPNGTLFVSGITNQLNSIIDYTYICNKKQVNVTHSHNTDRSIEQTYSIPELNFVFKCLLYPLNVQVLINKLGNDYNVIK
tara:strand:- start:679 stop:1269 length:591 start_codon:yes stop_codon:yes gene_type:complete